MFDLDPVNWLRNSPFLSSQGFCPPCFVNKVFGSREFSLRIRIATAQLFRSQRPRVCFQTVVRALCRNIVPLLPFHLRLTPLKPQCYLIFTISCLISTSIFPLLDRESQTTVWKPRFFGESLRGNTIRGNRTESLWEGNLPLRGSLRGSLKTSGKCLRAPLKISENHPSQRPSQRQISLSEALGPVAPNRVSPWTLSEIYRTMEWT